jgi:hypothetical protein
MLFVISLAIAASGSDLHPTQPNIFQSDGVLNSNLDKMSDYLKDYKNVFHMYTESKDNMHFGQLSASRLPELELQKILDKISSLFYTVNPVD